MLINRKDVVTFISGHLSPIFWKCICFENCDGFFVQGFEERVNNSVDLLSRVLVAFSVGQILALVTVTHFCCNLLLQKLEC